MLHILYKMDLVNLAQIIDACSLKINKKSHSQEFKILHFRVIVLIMDAFKVKFQILFYFIIIKITIKIVPQLS